MKHLEENLIDDRGFELAVRYKYTGREVEELTSVKLIIDGGRGIEILPSLTDKQVYFIMDSLTPYEIELNNNEE